MLQNQFKKEVGLINEMSVAKELGMTLTALRREITPEELYLWLLYFDFQNTQQREEMQKARRGRR